MRASPLSLRAAAPSNARPDRRPPSLYRTRLSGHGVALCGAKAAASLLRRKPATVLIEINKAVGLRLATKFGQKGAVNLVKLVPLAGGIVGGVINVIGTRIVGKTAQNLMRPEVNEPS